MRAVVQRVKKANVKVDDKIIGEIEKGLVILLGITHTDTEEELEALVQKLIHLRIFEDEENKLNKSLLDVKGKILSVSQFTLYGDVRKGRRPNFMKAAKPDQANQLYQMFNKRLSDLGVHVETGSFGAMMEVELINDGPVTIILEAQEGKITELS